MHAYVNQKNKIKTPQNLKTKYRNSYFSLILWWNMSWMFYPLNSTGCPSYCLDVFCIEQFIWRCCCWGKNVHCANIMQVIIQVPLNKKRRRRWWWRIPVKYSDMIQAVGLCVQCCDPHRKALWDPWRTVWYEVIGSWWSPEGIKSLLG